MGGNAAVPISQVVLKVHSRCDLACDHCYVYEAADQSWSVRPRVIADDVVAQAVRRIAEHVTAHALPVVCVVLHGGEPLLAGRDRLRRIITELRWALDGTCDLDLRIHTNGVRLSEDFCEILLSIGSKTVWCCSRSCPVTRMTGVPCLAEMRTVNGLESPCALAPITGCVNVSRALQTQVR
jgi:sulfatase maturation enzyme AslB (radical SAM superfamily)